MCLCVFLASYLFGGQSAGIAVVLRAIVSWGMDMKGKRSEMSIGLGKVWNNANNKAFFICLGSLMWYLWYVSFLAFDYSYTGGFNIYDCRRLFLLEETASAKKKKQWGMHTIMW